MEKHFLWITDLTKCFVSVNLKLMKNKPQKRAEEYLAGWKRTKADFINFKKEVEKQKQDWSQQGKEEVINKILPVLDGLEILTRELKKALEIQKVPVKKFDPSIHESIAGNGETINKVVQHGYKHKGKLIRPARVVLKE